MGIIQRIKGALTDVFPLRLNRTVKELNERIEAEGLLNSLLRTAFDTVRDINNEFRSENQRLSKALDDAQDEAREDRLKAERLQRIYADMMTRDGIPYWAPTRYCIDGGPGTLIHAHDPQFDFATIRIDLPALRLHHAVSGEMVRGGASYDLWAGVIAKGLGEAAKKEVFSAVLNSLTKTQRLLTKD